MRHPFFLFFFYQICWINNIASNIVNHPVILSAILQNIQQYCHQFGNNIAESAILPALYPAILLIQQYCWFSKIAGNIAEQKYCWQYCSNIAGNIADSAILLAYFPTTFPIWTSRTLVAFFQQYCWMNNMASNIVDWPAILSVILLNNNQYYWQYCWISNIAGNIASSIVSNIAYSAIFLAILLAILPTMSIEVLYDQNSWAIAIW